MGNDNENIQVVITIPDKTYSRIQGLVSSGYFDNQGIIKSVMEKVANGAALPKGHGDLKDADAIREIIKANQYLLSAKHNSTDYGMFTTGIMQAIDSIEPVVSADNPSPDIDVGRML